tara:strand:+ start:2044 stop:2334 length:291 start_codon:yes stop_codon:yes gene_type:complete
MNRLSTKLTNLRSQVQKLNSLFDNLKLKNVDLERENQNLQEKLARKIDRINAIKEERDLIINAKSLTEVGLSSTEARQKVNELIRGIDKCIAQLNQ